MAINPFEPPRSREPEPALSTAATLSAPGEVPEAALGELIAAAPWARWAARLSLLSLALTVLNAVSTTIRAKQTSEMVGGIAGAAIALPMTIIFLFIYRRYAADSERLARHRDPQALAGVLDGQRSLFKAYGILVLLGLSIVLLVILAGVIMCLAVRR
jgi:hypothetical protein